MDMNDRALRDMVIGLGGKSGGIPREDGFNITAASEIMAILCLAKDIDDLKNKMGNIYVGDTFDRKAIYARDLNAQGAMAVLLKDAIKPNLVQTLEGNPAIIHGGPFANIAQGTNTVIATKMGLTFSDYVVTEAGFGADLGAEKFLDIKCGYSGLSPKTIVLVVTVRAMKFHGGMALTDLKTPDVEALKRGMVNLDKHLENCRMYGVPVVVSINKFNTDTDEEIAAVKERCAAQGVAAATNESWGEGGAGATELATLVAKAVDSCTSRYAPVYDWKWTIEQKVEAVAKKVYGATSVEYTSEAKSTLRRIERLGLTGLPVCIAKTQYSFSDDPKKLGRPQDFEIIVRDFEIAAGAGFIVPITGSILRMPGLPSIPAAEGMDIDNNGVITGLS